MLRVAITIARPVIIIAIEVRPLNNLYRLKVAALIEIVPRQGRRVRHLLSAESLVMGHTWIGTMMVWAANEVGFGIPNIFNVTLFCV